MKRLLKFVALIIVLDQVLTPFSYSFNNDFDIISESENTDMVVEDIDSVDFESSDVEESDENVDDGGNEEGQAGSEVDSQLDEQDLLDAQNDGYTQDSSAEPQNDDDISSIADDEEGQAGSEVGSQLDEQDSLDAQDDGYTQDSSVEPQNDDDTSSIADDDEGQAGSEVDSQLDEQDSLDAQNDGYTQDSSAEPQNDNDISSRADDEGSEEEGEGSSNDTSMDSQLDEQTSEQVDTNSGATQNDVNEENTEDTGGIITTISEEIKEVFAKIRYFFRREGDSRYIKYGKDANNIGTITLKDPKSGVSITIMDKNLGAESVGLGKNSYGYYFQWGNNHGVKTVTSANKTTQKAVYKDSYYSHGYDGGGNFIVGGADYWENGEHYNSLWGNESKESSRYGACPVGYHIPTIKEWNQLLEIWGKIHTQDVSVKELLLRYSAHYSTRNVHTLKDAITLCGEGDIECIDENNLSVVAEILLSELKLPKAGSYDVNGEYHEGLGVYWTSISRDGSTAGVFDVDAYVCEGEDEKLMNKAQGHNIRCFQNVEPYEAPVISEDNDDNMSSGTNARPAELGENPESDMSMDSQLGEQTSIIEPTSEGETGSGEVEENTNPENDIPADNESNPATVDTTGDFVNEEIDVIEYTITWKNEDGSIRDTTKVASGQMPTHEDPVQPSDARYSYQFAGWEPELRIVDGDAEYKAKYTYIPMEYTITWKNEDGTVIDTTRVAYGQKPTHTNPVQPSDEKYSYRFAGWEPAISEVKGNVEYRAKYEYILNKCPITWKNEDGTIIDTVEVAYGEIPTHENPIQPGDSHYSYEFSGWNPQISEAIGPAEYRATYKYIVNKYIVTWKNEDGTVLKTDELEYGIMPIYDGEIPVKQSDGTYEYSFEGWNSEVSEVTGDMVYVATYHAEEIQTGDIAEIDSLVDSQNEENNLSGTEITENEEVNGENGKMGEENGKMDEEDGKTDEEESKTDEEGEMNELTEVIEIENSLDGDSQGNKEDQGFWSNLWGTLKSFFLDDEDGYLRGSETINNIVVSVEAEEGTFPEGTEVVIKGVPQQRLESIQTSLIEDESNNVTENAQILAFDISFVYSGEEIQPSKEVSVKFNYKENSGFQGASEKELSVYHIDDETDEGEEVEVVSKDGDEIEILATDFSIYVITLSDNNSVTLTLDPGDGTISSGSNIVVDGNGIGTITSVNGDVTLPNATRANYVFVGRYTGQTTSLQNFAGEGGDQYQVNSDITLYGAWCNNGYVMNTQKTTCILEGNLKTIMDQNPNFTYGEIPILRPDGWLDIEDPLDIIIMDRNLGATSSGTDNSAWGYYYQYGNNYGFTQNPPTIRRDVANVNLTQYSPSNPYYSGNFVIGKVGDNKYPNWPTTPNYNIWGYESDREEDRQGPCPAGWHIPTIEERNKVVAYWIGNNGGMNVGTFRTQLGLPLPGGIMRSDAKIEGNGTKGWFRTVSLNLSTEYVYELEVTSSNYSGSYSENMVNARQIRCFKNEDEMGIERTVVYTDGVNDREIFEDQIFSGLYKGDDFPQFSGNILSRTGENDSVHEFVGWFLSGSDVPFDVSGAVVQSDVILIARWTGCPEGEAENAYGVCVPTADTQRNLQIVQDLDVYFLASDRDKKHYTLMDRNMGATGIYNKNYSSPNSASFGYVYQWGNNYGFPARGDLVQQGVSTTTSQVPKSAWSKGIPSRYSSMTYYMNSNKDATWMAGGTTSDGIWGGTGDTASTEGANTTLEGRQGPCPVGYHVPSSVEIETIFMSWSGVSVYTTWKGTDATSAAVKFSEDFLIPPVGRRAGNGAVAMEVAMSYWSSSPHPTKNDRTLGFYWNPTDDGLKLGNDDGRARGRPVRCVKNTVNTSATAIATQDIHLNGGENAVISIDNGVISSLRSPTRTDSTFEGWYTSSDFSGNALAVGNTIQAGSSLYAKFTCNESGYVWNGSECELGVRLAFDSMGGTEVPFQIVKSGTTGVKPDDPIKTGYVFSGWFLTGASEEFNFTGTIIIGETTLYAHWNTGEYEVSIVSNNEDYGTVSSNSLTADYLTPISTNGNELTIGSTIVVATPSISGEQYVYIFSGRNNTCGDMLTGDCTITAIFDRIVNVYTATIVASPEGYGTVDSGSVIADYGTSITTSDNILTIGSTTITATPTASGEQYKYTFSGWTFSNCGNEGVEEIRPNCEITANFERAVNEYTVTWKNSDGSILETDTNVEYGTTPSYDGATPMSGGDVQYTYIFDTWIPAIITVTGDIEYIATYTQSVNVYTATIVASPEGYGTVDSGLVIADYGTSITTNDNILTIGSTTITATPTASGEQYTYTFSGWTFSNCGSGGLEEIEPNCEITANFERTVNEYTVTWKNYDGSVIKTDTGVAYGTTPEYSGSIPERPTEGIYAYVFSGWTPDISEVHGDQIYTAIYSRTTRTYTIKWKNIDGTVLETDNNVGRGATPQYNGEIPTNGVSNQYFTNTFAGWNPTVSTVEDDAEYFARYTYTVTSGVVLDTSKDSVKVTLNANGGQFSNNSGYDVLNYDYYNRAEKQYAHSANYSDDGIRNTAASSSDTGEYLTTITGAEYLYVNVTYDLQEILLGWVNDNKDKLYVYAGTSTSDEQVGYFEGDGNDGIQGNANYIITGDSVLFDFYLAKRTISSMESNGFYAVIVGVIPVGYITDDEAQTPSREGYTFNGWYTAAEGGDEVDIETLSVSGNMEVYAHWTPNNVQYVVYHYVKRVGQSTYALTETETGYAATDSILALSGLAKSGGFVCATYDKGSLTGTENGPGEIVTGAVIRGDGSTKIYLYYDRNKRNVILSGDEHVESLMIGIDEREGGEEAVRECGDNVPVEAVPKPGYHFVRWDREIREENGEDDEPEPLPGG